MNLKYYKSLKDAIKITICFAITISSCMTYCSLKNVACKCYSVFPKTSSPPPALLMRFINFGSSKRDR